MSEPGEKKQWVTARGAVSIYTGCTPERLETWSMDSDFARFSNYRPIISSKTHLLETAADPEANVTAAVNEARRLIGLAILQPPETAERWHRVGARVMMEVAVIEVVRSWRSLGISGQMLACLINGTRAEDHIYYMVGYSWTWDLAGTGLRPIEYRKMMIRLFAGQGFRTYQTNEPNIMMRPENLFMARIGARISKGTEQTFKRVRFNMDR